MINNKKVSVIIPARNEEGCIGAVIRQIPRPLVDEIVVVDGASTDNTKKEAREAGARIIDQAGRGYGGGVQQGAAAATGDIFILMDSDGSHPPEYVPQLLAKVNEGYEYVMGSRYMAGARRDDDTFIRWTGHKVFTLLTNLLHSTGVTDSIYTYNAIPRDAFFKINAKSQGFEYCTEILVRAKKAGLRFAEVPVIEHARIAGDSKVNAFWHGLKILRMILRRYN